ncbi:MAG: glycosyltransferase [Acidimicrobiia bacterium]|nr:glycosyltransferase [Acidimicrobiia bacterium]
MARLARPPGRWDDYVLFCAGKWWDGNRGAEHNLVDNLVEHVPVVWVDPPLSLLSPRRFPELARSLEGPRFRLIRPNLAHLTPVVPPGMRRPGMVALTELLVRRLIRRAINKLGHEPNTHVLALDLDLFDLDRPAKRVLYATDDFTAGAGSRGVSENQSRRNEERIAEKVDLVVAISPELVETWRRVGCRAELVPNGCEARRLATVDAAPEPDDVDLSRPIVGFVGHITERIDLGLVEAVADRGLSVLLVGPHQITFDPARLEPLLARPNVVWVGSKTSAELPSYLRMMDVGITPYADSEFNRASMPLKTLEYLAAGRPAVSTDLPSARWLDTDLIFLASGPGEFADATERAIAGAHDVDLVARRRAFAAGHDWSKRAEQFAAVLRDLTDPAPSS